jgi:multiple sugar transport system permease protein
MTADYPHTALERGPSSLPVHVRLFGRIGQNAGFLLLLPAIGVLLALTIYPVGYGVWMSFFNKHSLFPQQHFVGLDNYLYLMQDKAFWDALWNGTVYALSTVVLQLVIGVAAALVLNEAFPGRNIVRGVVLFPYVIPTVVAMILWKWLLNNQFGLVNYLFVTMGLVDEPVSWMGRSYIMTSLIFISVWQFFPFVVLAVLARMQTIPTELYDAAKVDGASAIRRFVHVTLPQLTSVLFVIVLLRGIWMFTKFDTVWLITQGGGAEKYVRTLPVYAYLRTFNFYQAGLGAAIGVIMFIALVIAMILYFRVFKRDENL